MASLRAARKLESLVKLWTVKPANELLTDREANEAYLAAAPPGRPTPFTSPHGGKVRLDLREAPGPLRLRWINIDNGEWGTEQTLAGGEQTPITAPSKGNWAAAITRP